MKWIDELKEDWYRDNYFPIPFEKDEAWQEMERHANIVYGYIFRHIIKPQASDKDKEIQEVIRKKLSIEGSDIEKQLKDKDKEIERLAELLRGQAYSIWKGCESGLNFDEWNKKFLYNHNL